MKQPFLPASAKLAVLTGLILLALFPVITTHAQTLPAGSQTVYDDALENGWQNYGWATLNYANTSPVHGSGGTSIRVDAGAYQALYLHHDYFDATPYASLTFWIHGGTVGGQIAPTPGQCVNGNALARRHHPRPASERVAAGHPVSSPVSARQAQASFDGFWLQNTTGATLPTFYVDDIALVANPPPAAGRRAGERRQRRPAGRRAHLRGEHRHLGQPTGHRREPLAARGDRRRVAALSRRQRLGRLRLATRPQRLEQLLPVGQPVPDVRAPGGRAGRATLSDRQLRQRHARAEAAAWVAYANGSPANTLALGTDAKGRNWQTVGYWAALRAAAPLASDDGYNFLRAFASRRVRFPVLGSGQRVLRRVGRRTITAALSLVRRRTRTPTRRTSRCSARRCSPSIPRSTWGPWSSAGRTATATASTRSRTRSTARPTPAGRPWCSPT